MVRRGGTVSHVRANLLYRLSRLVNRMLARTAPLSRSLRKALLELAQEDRSKGGKGSSLLEKVVNLPGRWEGLEYYVVNALRGTAGGITSFQSSIEKSFALASLLAGVLTVVSLMVLVIVHVS